MHDELGFAHEHNEGLSEVEYQAVARAIMEHDTLEMLTVGIDIGSSTSHLLFARVLFERRGERGADRFVVVERTVEWRSPILLTPFRPDGTIDAHRLAHFVEDCYAEAGYGPADVDSGAVILTGEAIKRRNARAIDEMLAGGSGRFVCATAGHRLECVLAAHGSGATALNRRRGGRGLHVDIGGGTTKLAVVEDGEVRSVAAFAVGGRLVAQDDAGEWTRVDEAAATVARSLGLVPEPRTFADAGARRRLADRLAELVVDQVVSGAADDLGKALELTEPLDRPGAIDYLTVSGGVAEYVFGHETRFHGDIARELAAGVVRQLAQRVDVPAVDPGQRIRATVIGASQFSVQVSGRTVHLGDGSRLPVANVPVVRAPVTGADGTDAGAFASAVQRRASQLEVALDGAAALAVPWAGPASYRPLVGLAHAIADAVGRDGGLLVVAVDADVARALGGLLVEEAGVTRPLVVLDGIELADLDLVDVGEFVDPPGVVPVVVKSLLFG